MNQAGGWGGLTPSHPSRKAARQQDEKVGESTLCCGERIQAGEKLSCQAEPESRGRSLGPGLGRPLMPATLGGPPGRAPPSRGPRSPRVRLQARRHVASCEPASLWARCCLRNVVPVPVPGSLYGAEIIHQIFGMCN